MASKKICFSIPDWLYKGLEDLPFMNGNIRVEDLFKASAINRMIERGYLDEFGCPIELPELKFDDINLRQYDFNSILGKLDSNSERIGK